MTLFSTFILKTSSSEMINIAKKLIVRRDIRLLSSAIDTAEIKGTPDVKNEETLHNNVKPRGRRLKDPLSGLRFIYPEFLPDPNPKFRNSLREKLERDDMMKRRNKIDIPEFYVGSILAVTVSDAHSQSKINRFVGICIDRQGCGLRAQFILRNVVNHQGVEIKYDLYDPTVQKIEVLKLEKRLDDKLYYLRDALPEYSTFSFDLEPDILPEGSEVPINTTQVKLKPRPWLERWERQELKGISNIEEYLKEKDRVRRELRKTPWEKYDLMKQYRTTIPAEDQSDIWKEVNAQLHQLQLMSKKNLRKRTIGTPKSRLG